MTAILFFDNRNENCAPAKRILIMFTLSTTQSLSFTVFYENRRRERSANLQHVRFWCLRQEKECADCAGSSFAARRRNCFVGLLDASERKVSEKCADQENFLSGVWLHSTHHRLSKSLSVFLEADNSELTFKISTILFSRFSISRVFDSWMFSRLNKFRSESNSKIICLNHSS